MTVLTVMTSLHPSNGDCLDDMTLAKAKLGDTGAFTKLVQRYEKPVFAVISRIVGARGSSDFDDIAQETFLSVHKSLRRFSSNGKASLSTWILTIASRRAVDYLRQNKTPFELIDQIVDRTAASSPAYGLHRREVAAAITEAMKNINAKFRAAFVLREIHQFSYEEVSTALNIPIGTVRSRLHRIRAGLRLQLQEVNHD